MKTWFITGASSGFGREIAQVVLEEGDRAVVTARNTDALAALVAQDPERVHAVALELTQPESIASAAREAEARFGAPDVLVNNAGYGLLAALEETDDAHLQQNLETNLLGPLRLTRAVLPAMRQRGSGRIISMSAAAASGNYPGFGIYGAAKAGLEAASEALAAELKPFGIFVSVIVPGPFRTDFIGRSLARVPRQPAYEATVGRFEKLLQGMHGKQPGDPRRAAEAIYHIASQPKPPFRLVLGKYANGKHEAKLVALRAELAEWKDVGLPTDFAAAPR